MRNLKRELQLDRIFELREIDSFLLQHVFCYLKFFDSSHEQHAEENFYMEREWRASGSVNFGMNDVSNIIVPEGYENRLRSDTGYQGKIESVALA